MRDGVFQAGGGDRRRLRLGSAGDVRRDRKPHHSGGQASSAGSHPDLLPDWGIHG